MPLDQRRTVETSGKREGGAAVPAAAPAYSDPIVMLVVCLLAAASVAHDRVLFTTGQSRKMISSQSSAQPV
jgi:hypothetical protein